jgi:hypothetical protein
VAVRRWCVGRTAWPRSKPTEAVYDTVLNRNPYQPHLARIVRIYRMVEDNYLFTLRFFEDRLATMFRHQPGQFVMLSVPGTGEAPISISSSPTRPGILELCMRRAGRVTKALYRMHTNDVVGVRGPQFRALCIVRYAFNPLRAHRLQPRPRRIAAAGGGFSSTLRYCT